MGTPVQNEHESSNTFNQILTKSVLGAAGFAFVAAKKQSIFWLFPAKICTNAALTELAQKALPFSLEELNCSKSLKSFALRNVIDLTSAFGSSYVAVQLGLSKAIALQAIQFHLLSQSYSLMNQALTPLVDQVAQEIFSRWPVEKDYQELIQKTVVQISSTVCLASLAGLSGIFSTAAVSLFLTVSTVSILKNSGMRLAMLVLCPEEINTPKKLFDSCMQDIKCFSEAIKKASEESAATT